MGCRRRGPCELPASRRAGLALNHAPAPGVCIRVAGRRAHRRRPRPLRRDDRTRCAARMLRQSVHTASSASTAASGACDTHRERSGTAAASTYGAGHKCGPRAARNPRASSANISTRTGTHRQRRVHSGARG
jgi:hypothetical protein